MTVKSLLDGLQPLPKNSDRAAIDHELLLTLNEQARSAMPPIIVSATIIGGLAANSAPLLFILLWVGVIACFQPFRIRYIARQVQDESRPVEDRLAKVVRLSLLHGSLFASSIGLFFYMDGTARAMYTMMIATIAGTSITTCNGYAGPSVSFVAPMLTALVVGWLVLPLAETSNWIRYSIVLLLFMHAGFLIKHAQQIFTWFIERIQTTTELQRALNAEKRASSAKTRFLAAASHDLRQPLHTMSLLSAALTMRPLDDKSSTIAQNMNEAMGDLASELDSLLDISKLDAGVVSVDRSAVRVDKLLERIARGYLAPAHEKGLDLELNDAVPVTVYSDKVLLERLLRNLLDNAVKYTMAGKIQIDLDHVDEQCVVKIIDTGIGVEADRQERIFEEFYQVGNQERDRNQGLGLGLSIVSRIAGILGIEINFQSTPGVGSSFELALPAISTAPANALTPELAFSEIAGAQVMLVEDDASVRFATETFLQEAGCIVTSAGGTAAALSALASQGKPDVVIADIRLPEGDSGITAIGRLRDRLPGLAAILVTGESSEDRQAQARDLGVTMLTKPVEQESLVREIARLLTLSRQQV
jgi:signal transduction histidine kinase/ActR/RegA family two-component response regulator